MSLQVPLHQVQHILLSCAAEMFTLGATKHHTTSENRTGSDISTQQHHQSPQSRPSRARQSEPAGNLGWSIPEHVPTRIFSNHW